MTMIITTDNPLSQSRIAVWLGELRKKSYAPKSSFAVASILEIKKHQQYYYFAGTNVESLQHNRMGLHAEQTALVNAVTCLGSHFHIERCFVMGGPAALDAAQPDPLTNKVVWPCGHCRQLLTAFSYSKSTLQAVTLSGQFSATENILDLLPLSFTSDNFSGSDSSVAESHQQCYKDMDITTTNNVIDCIQGNLNSPDKFDFLKQLQPYILDQQFCTGTYSALLIDLQNDLSMPAVLMQDIAFLTTDPLYGALSLAVTRDGRDKVNIRKLALYQDTDTTPAMPNLLTADERQTLSQFTPDQGIALEFYNCNGLQLSGTL